MKPSRVVLVVQHVPHEGPYAIGTALEAAGLSVRVCRAWAGETVPESPARLAALVVMGGPMAAYRDSPTFATRTAELALLRATLKAELPVLGVCLGAQLLAMAGGGTARRGDGLQIGWEEVRMTSAVPSDPLFATLPDRLRVLHWHGDTMELPAGATLLASCDRYPVQAFRIGGSAWGLQFHMEVDKAAVDAFVAAFPDEAATAPNLLGSTPTELATLAPHRDGFFARFAALVASRAA